MRRSIGITIGYSKRSAGIFALQDDYVRAVEKAGGLPLVLAPGRPEDASELLDRLGGLLLSGGSDVDPRLYGEHPHPALSRVFPNRDAFETALCREAVARDMPVLAICRGHQVLNVAMGGTLVQDIPSELTEAMEHDPEIDRWETAHEVRILRGTRLFAVLRRETVSVNSFHHQAVKRLGRGLREVAWAPDGIIEGVELELPDTETFVVGVQWHPEDLVGHDAAARRLFAAFVDAAGRRG